MALTSSLTEVLTPDLCVRTQMKLIEEWRKAYKFLTVQLAVGLGFVATAYEYLPAVQSYLPEGWVKWFAIAIIVARVIKQNVEANKPTQKE